jgi:hypothetical protein
MVNHLVSKVPLLLVWRPYNFFCRTGDGAGIDIGVDSCYDCSYDYLGRVLTQVSCLLF